jgi:hypothetical protein
LPELFFGGIFKEEFARGRGGAGERREEFLPRTITNKHDQKRGEEVKSNLERFDR